MALYHNRRRVMERVNLANTISQIFQSEYVIPMYQRNFAWREEEITTLLTDIWESFHRAPDSNYYIGSLIVCKRTDDQYEVIDGQQRLTVLSLIAKHMGFVSKRKLSYDSRPHHEAFLDALYSNKNEYTHPSTLYLEKAVKIVREANLDESRQGEDSLTIDRAGAEFVEYFKNKVILVRVELPEDTDMATYFEIMNNRGEQLQEHEILKSLMMSELEPSKQKEFSSIWDACSQMNAHIQEKFGIKARRKYFGDNCQSFLFRGLSDDEDSENILPSLSINEILKSDSNISDKIVPQEDMEDLSCDEDLESIIDFPNFLMHIFRAFFNDIYVTLSKGDSVPLDAKFMLKVYELLITDKNLDRKKLSEEFILRLFMSRVYFDAYVVKAVNVQYQSEDDSVRWSLKRVAVSSNGKLYLHDTYMGNTYMQARLVKALSMLQVTYRTKRYKNWLQEAIQFFRSCHDTSINLASAGDQYLKHLEKYMLDRCKGMVNTENTFNAFNAGTATPHFLFNFIDYLYWIKSINEPENPDFGKLEDFDFKYWNSVEHHLSRKKAESINGSETYINNIGNLCLLSRSTNSKLSDRDVKEKVEMYSKGNMGPKRQIMYAMTRANNFKWTKEEIEEHHKNILELLKQRRIILSEIK